MEVGASLVFGYIIDGNMITDIVMKIINDGSACF